MAKTKSKESQDKALLDRLKMIERANQALNAAKNPTYKTRTLRLVFSSNDYIENWKTLSINEIVLAYAKIVQIKEARIQALKDLTMISEDNKVLNKDVVRATMLLHPTYCAEPLKNILHDLKLFMDVKNYDSKRAKLKEIEKKFYDSLTPETKQRLQILKNQDAMDDLLSDIDLDNVPEEVEEDLL